MAQSGIDACNSALQKVGEPPIMSLDGPSKSARQCTIAFDSNRRAELAKRPWNFAIKRAQLAPDSAAPAFDYAYQFTLPSDCLRIIKPRDAYCDWVVEGRKILTNQGPALNLRYVCDVTDVTQWSSVFYDLFAVSLALDLCESITNSANKRSVLLKEYGEALALASAADAFEKLPSFAPDDDFWIARLGTVPNRVNFTTPAAGI